MCFNLIHRVWPNKTTFISKDRKTNSLTSLMVIKFSANKLQIISVISCNKQHNKDNNSCFLMWLKTLSKRNFFALRLEFEQYYDFSKIWPPNKQKGRIQFAHSLVYERYSQRAILRVFHYTWRNWLFSRFYVQMGRSNRNLPAWLKMHFMAAFVLTKSNKVTKEFI